MLALYVIASAYAAAVVCAAGRLYILGCAPSLRRALALHRALAAANAKPTPQPSPQGKTPTESTYSGSHAIVNPPTPVLQWPRDN